MILERFFGKGKGKGRAAEAKPPGREETNPRRSQDPVTVAGSTAPRTEVTNAPAFQVRSDEVSAPQSTTATATMIGAANGPSLPPPPPTYEEIAARAYDLWQERGRPEGREHENWIEAERQLRAKRTRG